MPTSNNGKSWYRRPALSVALVASIALLTACSSNESIPDVVNEIATETRIIASQVAQAPDWGHVHNLSLVGDVVYIGSHNGFWKQEVGQDPVLLSQPVFDVMGLAGSKEKWFASGHPGPDMEAPSDLGLIESVDGGVTWQSVSLLGKADFHRAAAVGNFVLGLVAHSGSLLRSNDGGSTWSDLGTPVIFDFAINPTNPDVVLATSENGTLRSEDGGETFTPVTTPELLAFVAWGEQGLYAASTEGQIIFSSDNGANWDARGSLGATPGALATDAGNVVALVDDSIWGSIDNGVTFVKRVAGSGQH
jgi:hypothetical protein